MAVVAALASSVALVVALFGLVRARATGRQLAETHACLVHLLGVEQPAPVPLPRLMAHRV
jgi:hypothetical protein